MSASSTSQSPQDAPSPRKVALAIAIFFPYGFYLLWKHPTLGKKLGWWIGGIAYVVFTAFVLGNGSPDTKSMRRIAEATLPAVYGDYEMKWGKDFLAGTNASKYGWGGIATLADGRSLFVSFFPKGNDFVWLSSPSDGGVFAAGFSDTTYWDSRGERIENDEEFWKRAGLTKEEVMKESKQMAKLNRANEEKKKQRASEKFMRDWNEYKPSR
jgi:hypothetical protein